jgi:formiminotetrahydrofolate cyclodeaminase
VIPADDSLQAWSDALAAPTPTPAGGAAAAITAALAAALVEMVATLTASRESYADARPVATATVDRAGPLRRRLLALAVEDVEAFQTVVDALALPRGTEAEIAQRTTARNDALKAAAGVQFELLLLAGEVVDLAQVLVERGLRSAVGDAASAVFLAAGAARSAYWAIRSNLRRMYEDVEALRMEEAALERLELVEAVEVQVKLRLSERL